MVVNILSYSQWKTKHAASPKYQALPKTEQKKRYDSYVLSMNSGNSPKVSFQKSASSKKKSVPSVLRGGTNKGKSAAQAAAGLNGYTMNPKTHDFLTARSNPWCPRIRDVGYPAACAAGSIKWKAFARGTLQTNAAGFGYIQICPGLSGWPDQNCIAYSLQGNALASDTTPASFGPFPGVQSGLSPMKGGPFALGGLTPPIIVDSTFCRVNALGCKIRSDAALLLKAGSIKCYALPLMGADAFNISGADMLTTYSQWTTWYQANIAETPWFSTLFSPPFPMLPQRQGASFGQDQFQQEGGAMSLDQIFNNASCTMGIMISGAPNQTYDWDVTGWYEVFGSIVFGSSYSTPTHSDPIGQGIVESVSQSQSLQSMTKTATGATEATSFLSVLADGAKSVLGQIDAGSILKSFMGSTTSAPAADVSPTPVAGPEMGYSGDVDAFIASLPDVPAAVADVLPMLAI